MSVLDDNWNYSINMKEIDLEYFGNFEKKVININDLMLKLLDDAFKIHRFVFNGTIDPKNDDELLQLIENNKQLRHDIDKKLEVLGYQQNKYETYKNDQKILSQEVKEKHEAFLMAKKFYKKYLKMYYTIESKNDKNQTIFLQFFTEAKKDSENYSLRLLRNTKTGQYELLSTTPKLNSLKDLQKMIKTTNDVPELLCNVRQAFLFIKTKK